MLNLQNLTFGPVTTHHDCPQIAFFTISYNHRTLVVGKLDNFHVHNKYRTLVDDDVG